MLMNANQKIQPRRRSDQTSPLQVGKLLKKSSKSAPAGNRAAASGDLKEIVNAVHVTKNGCVWHDVPGELPPWQTICWKASQTSGD